MGGLLRRGWSRRIYRWLTTSARDLRNRVDDVGSNLQAARRARNEVQQVNDFFHAAGKGMSRAATVEGITLQGEDEGVAWSFLLLPAIFVVGLLTFISQYRRGGVAATTAGNGKEECGCRGGAAYGAGGERRDEDGYE